MLDAAIAFFVMAMIATLLGASEFAGVSTESSQTLLVLFLALSMLSLVASLVTGNSNYKDPL